MSNSRSLPTFGEAPFGDLTGTGLIRKLESIQGDLIEEIKDLVSDEGLQLVASQVLITTQLALDQKDLQNVQDFKKDRVTQLAEKIARLNECRAILHPQWVLMKIDNDLKQSCQVIRTNSENLEFYRRTAVRWSLEREAAKAGRSAKPSKPPFWPESGQAEKIRQIALVADGYRRKAIKKVLPRLGVTEQALGMVLVDRQLREQPTKRVPGHEMERRRRNAHRRSSTLSSVTSVEDEEEEIHEQPIHEDRSLSKKARRAGIPFAAGSYRRASLYFG